MNDSPKYALTVRSQTYVFAALLVLAGTSYALSFAALGVLTVPVALAISCAKGVLVAVFFMELVDQRFSNRFVMVVAIGMVLILLAFVAADVLTRGVPPLLPART